MFEEKVLSFPTEEESGSRNVGLAESWCVVVKDLDVCGFCEMTFQSTWMNTLLLTSNCEII